jgi:hypothetical protein
MLTQAHLASSQVCLCQVVGKLGKTMQGLPVMEIHLNHVHIQSVSGESGLATDGIHALAPGIDPVIISRYGNEMDVKGCKRIHTGRDCGKQLSVRRLN